jgi:hypothetical protein
MLLFLYGQVPGSTFWLWSSQFLSQAAVNSVLV